MIASIGAVILAAGLSRRMGQPKLLLPWGKVTVLEQVILVLRSCGIEDIVAVTGGAREQVEALLQRRAVQPVFNASYAEGEMLSSIKAGLPALDSRVEATLVVLGDQPQIEGPVVESVIAAYRQSGAPLVVPSYQMRRGHPWLVTRALWQSLLEIEPPRTLRDFLQDHSAEIEYALVNSPSILKDLDTPQDYQNQKPPIN